jgi:hypothetical protein
MVNPTLFEFFVVFVLIAARPVRSGMLSGRVYEVLFLVVLVVVQVVVFYGSGYDSARKARSNPIGVLCPKFWDICGGVLGWHVMNCTVYSDRKRV